MFSVTLVRRYCSACRYYVVRFLRLYNKQKRNIKVFETLSHVDEYIVTNVLEGRNSSSSGSSNQPVLDPNDGAITLFRMFCKHQ